MNNTLILKLPFLWIVWIVCHTHASVETKKNLTRSSSNVQNEVHQSFVATRTVSATIPTVPTPRTRKIKRTCTDSIAVLRVPLHYQSGSHHVSIHVPGDGTRTSTSTTTKTTTRSTKNLIVDTGSRLTTWRGNCLPSLNNGREIRNNNKSNRSRSSKNNSNRNNNNNKIYNRSCVFEQDSICRKDGSTSNNSSNSSNSNSCDYCEVKQKYTEGSGWVGYEKGDTVTFEYYYSNVNHNPNNYHHYKDTTKQHVKRKKDDVNTNMNTNMNTNTKTTTTLSSTNSCRYLYNNTIRNNSEENRITKRIINSTWKQKKRTNTKSRQLKSTSFSYNMSSSFSTVSFPFTYACQTSVTGLFQNQYADGILGLGPYYYHSTENKNPTRYNKNSSISSFPSSSLSSSIFIDSLYRHGIIHNKAFSLCLTKTGGYMGLGGPLVQYHSILHQHCDDDNDWKDGTNNTRNVRCSNHDKQDTCVSGMVETMQYTPMCTWPFYCNITNDIPAASTATATTSTKTINNQQHQIDIKSIPLDSIHTNMTKKKKEKRKKNNPYRVLVDEVWFGTTCLTCNNDQYYLNSFNTGKGTIFDSGTTDVYLPKAISHVFNAVWNQYYHKADSRFMTTTTSSTDRIVYRRSTNTTGNNTSKCRTTGGCRSRIEEEISSRYDDYYYTIDQFQQLPDLRFVFQNNVTMSIHPINYMDSGGTIEERQFFHTTIPSNITTTTNDDHNNNRASASTTTTTSSTTSRNCTSMNDDIVQYKKWKSRIYTTEPAGAVLGLNSMIGYDILFDTDNQRIGIAQAECVHAVDDVVDTNGLKQKDNM